MKHIFKNKAVLSLFFFLGLFTLIGTSYVFFPEVYPDEIHDLLHALRPAPDVDLPAADALYTCNTAADCVLVKETCGCSCSGCGIDFDTSINRRYVEEWNANLNCPPEYNMLCPMVCCPEASPACVENRCSYVMSGALE